VGDTVGTEIEFSKRQSCIAVYNGDRIRL